MKLVCVFCGDLIRWTEPIDQPGISYGTCEDCLHPVECGDPWVAWRDEGGGEGG